VSASAATSAEDVESLERATLAAVGAGRVRELEGWLLGLTPGTISRAKSAAPMRHEGVAGHAALDAIEAAYREVEMEPAFRIADVAGLDPAREHLQRRGYDGRQPTVVQQATASALLDALHVPPADLAERPGDDWLQVFAGPGFDPADGANRLAALSRSKGAVYASVRQEGRTVALGVASIGYGWAGVHGMRTSQAFRGYRLAERVLAALASAALARGCERLFLQVETSNAPALSLYRRAGFAPLWTYRYWS
jgi:N-acetylglutamate synthase